MIIPGKAASWLLRESGARFLARRKAAASVAVLSMALALGANALVFSITRAFLYSSFGVPEPTRLGIVAPVREMPGRGSVVFSEAYPNYLSMREALRSFAGLACIAQGLASWQTGDEVRPLQSARVTASFFATTRVRPVLGRGFEVAEEGPNPALVAVISHALWQSAFGGTRNVLGRTITLNGAAHTIVGVMPAGFRHPLPTDVWLPFDIAPTAWTSITGARSLSVYGRLRDGVADEAVAAELTAFTQRAIAASPDNRDFVYTFQGFRQVLFPKADRTLLFVQAGALLLVLLAVANLASLLIAWGFDRRQEMAVRLALGAGPGQIVRMLLLQSALVVAAGGVTGLLLARSALPWVRHLEVSPTLALFLGQAELDTTVLLLSGLAIGIAGVVAGLLPAVLTRRACLADALRASNRSVTLSRAAVRWQQTMVLAQVALSMVIVALATLLGVSFRNLVRVPAGFASADRIVARVHLGAERYATHEARALFAARLLEHLQAENALRAASFTSTLPVGDNIWAGRFHVNLEDAALGVEPLLLHFRRIAPNYLDVMRVPLLRGRYLEPQDDAAQRKVAVVSQAAAARLWPAQDAVGKRLYRVLSSGPPEAVEVVGVVGDAMDAGFSAPAGETVYVPFAQISMRQLSIVGHASDTRAGLDAIRSALQRTDPTLAAADPATVASLVSQANALPRLQSIVLLTFAIVALSLVGLGSYGVMSQLVANREREFALRLVFGAQPSQLGCGVLLQIGRLAAVGAALGALVVWLLQSLLQPLLFGVAPRSPAVLLLVSLMIVLLATGAAVAPALRAMRVDVQRGTVAL